MSDLAENNEEQSLEVKKLQELVQKLEQQNEMLRQKADGDLSAPASKAILPDTGLTLQQAYKHSGENGSESDNTETKLHNTSRTRTHSRTEDSDLESHAGDEDSWLYTSPLKAPTPDQKSVSPYDWIRQDFEKPNTSMDSARISLLAKLEEVSRANRSSQILPKPQPIPEVDVVQPEEVEPPDSHHPPERSTSHEEKLFKKLEDVTDVQILAKMQEESLRQALQSISPAASPNTTPRVTPRGHPGVSPNSPERSVSSRTSSFGSSEGGGDDIPVVSGVIRRRPRGSPGQGTPEGSGSDDVPVVTSVRRRGKNPANHGLSDATVPDGHYNADVPVVTGAVRRRGKAPSNIGPPNGTVTDGHANGDVPVVTGVRRRGNTPSPSQAPSDGVMDGDIPVVAGVRRRGAATPPPSQAFSEGAMDGDIPVVAGVRRRGAATPPPSQASSNGTVDVPVVSGVRRRGATPPPNQGPSDGTNDGDIPVVSGVRRRGAGTPPPSHQGLSDGADNGEIPVVTGVRRRGKVPPTGSPERAVGDGQEEEDIPVVSNVVRRRPSMERVKREDFRRHSYGARYSMGSDLNNGDHLQVSDLQKLALVPPSAEYPTVSKANQPQTGRMLGGKRGDSEPPPPPPPTPCTDADPGMRQPAAGNHVTSNRGSSLRQPSPVTTGRIPTPKRSIPVRQIPTPKTGLPRPRSAAIPKSQLPTPGSKSAIPARRPSPQF